VGNQNESEQLVKTNKTPSSSAALTGGLQNNHSKLVSLLALAAGAAAMPQTSNADIIYNNQSATVSWGGLHAFTISSLPGNAQLGFTAHKIGTFSVTSIRSITGGKRGSGYLQFKASMVTQPLLWNQIGGSALSAAKFAQALSTTHSPNGYGALYLAFEFKDSSQAGSPMRYGWAGISLANGDTGGGGNYPRLTVSGWAYDTTGAQIPMGLKASVPEPGSMTLLALGALTLGARGVRSWRRNRAAASQS
jgi:hypothetical protein